MNKNIINTFRKGLFVAAGLAAMYSCSDTWEEHYEALPNINFNGTTMQALEEKASDFAALIKATGYDRELNADNLYTIWAPANGSFKLSDYVDANGNLIPDSAETVKRFIKNHMARKAYSLDLAFHEILLMNQKKVTMTSKASSLFGDYNIVSANTSCKNGIVHVIDNVNPYVNNLFEQIVAEYNASNNEHKKDSSLYGFLRVWDADSLDEVRSVSRGVDADGNKIWVDSVVIRNNRALKNVDALIYREDSTYITIIPTVEAFQKRYGIAKELLKFNPKEDQSIEGACDSLQNYFANMFAMTDLYFNVNANEHFNDSLKSTNYEKYNWEENVYYKPFENGGILSPGKYTAKVDCSNGTAYLVDEYPMSVTDQFFKRIRVPASSFSVDRTIGDDGKLLYTKNVGSMDVRSGTIYDYDEDSVLLGTRNYRYMDVKASSSSTTPTIAFQVPNTLSGTYDIFLVTTPIWAADGGFEAGKTPEDDPRGYRFYTYIWERENDGKNLGRYPASGFRLATPKVVPEEYQKYADPANNYNGNYFMTTPDNKVDTLYIGQHTFKNCYYSRNDEGVLIQFAGQVTNALTSKFSRRMLITSVFLKPRFEEVAEEAKRK